MFDANGFNGWADEYDNEVRTSEENDEYPFAGYNEVLGLIEQLVAGKTGHTVLDIGFGTAVLTRKLYDKGCKIYGQDFSTSMIEIAQKKMPKAELFCGDMSDGLVPELCRNKYDSIIATYSIHHLSDDDKIDFIKQLLPLLNENGSIFIGDVLFKTRAELEACRSDAGEAWDEDEIYVVVDELKKRLSNVIFHKITFCSGVIEIKAY